MLKKQPFIVPPRSLSENSGRSEGKPGLVRFFDHLKRIVGPVAKTLLRQVWATPAPPKGRNTGRLHQHDLKTPGQQGFWGSLSSDSLLRGCLKVDWHTNNYQTLESHYQHLSIR